jgi:hypothetical protein
MSKTIQLAMSPKQFAANINEAKRIADRIYNNGGDVDYVRSNAMPPSGQIVAANASLFNQAFFNRPLTQYATGWKDPSPIDADLEFYAPSLIVPRRFTYAEFTNIEEFFVDVNDDLRPIRGDFKTVEYNSDKVEAKTDNRGLRLVIDFDEEEETPDWQELAVDKLMRRLKRNSFVRALTLISAASVNNALVWDDNADPDQDVINYRIAATTVSGVPLNRIGYGDTAWATRTASLRGNNNSAKFASAAMTPEQLAGMLAVDTVNLSKERQAISMTAKAEVLGNLVLMFFAQSNPDRMDPSNVKRFISNCSTGGKYATYVRQISTKLWEVVVECYEKTTITSSLGMQQLTVTKTRRESP